MVNGWQHLVLVDVTQNTETQSQPESESEVTGVRASEVRTRKQKKGVREQV